MSRLCWSNLPDANSPRGGTSTLCSSLTTDDLPMPEYPETSTSSGVPLVTTRSKAPNSVDSAVDVPLREAAPQVMLDAGGRLIAILGGLGEQLHDDRRDRLWQALPPRSRRRRSLRDVS